jgi:20S proteasome subunit beta 4
MDVLFGLVGDGFVLLVSDTSRVQSIVVQRTEVDKIVHLDSHKLMARALPLSVRCVFARCVR